MRRLASPHRLWSRKRRNLSSTARNMRVQGGSRLVHRQLSRGVGQTCQSANGPKDTIGALVGQDRENDKERVRPRRPRCNLLIAGNI